MKDLGRALLALVFLCGASAATAQLSVSTGGTFALNGGSLNLDGTGLQVNGVLSLAGGRLLNAANVAIGAGGTFDASNGQVTLSGDWSDAGSFLGGGSQVGFVDGPASSQITGNTTFATLSFVSATGKNYVFGTGSTQTISQLLTITGTAGAPIQFRSSAAGQVANIDLLAGGAQNISHVGVSDVHATGQQLAPNQTNEGGTGNATGWFAAVVQSAAVAAPALSRWAAMLLGVMLAGFALRQRRPQ